MLRKEILLARKIPRNKSLDKEKNQRNDSKLAFNVTYYLVFRHLKSQVKELHVILACNEDLFFLRRTYFKVSIKNLKNSKNLKSHLVRVALPDINEVDRCEPCCGKRPPCQLCSNMKNASTFKSKHSNRVYQIKKKL